MIHRSNELSVLTRGRRQFLEKCSAYIKYEKKQPQDSQLIFPNAVLPCQGVRGAEADQAVAVDVATTSCRQGKPADKRYPQNMRALLTLPSPAKAVVAHTD